MTSELSTYYVASFIHDSVWLRNGVLDEDLLAGSGLRRSLGHMTNTEQVVGIGSDPTQPAYETLTKGRNGLYYFHATPGFTYNGDLTMGRHVITPSSGQKTAQRFASSIIVREFLSLTEDEVL